MIIVRQALKYFSTGLINTGLGLSVIFVLQSLEVHHVAANAGGYATGFAIGFILNRAWSFEIRGRISLSEVIKYILIFAISYIANLITLLVMVEFFGVNSYVAQASGVLVYSALNFTGLRHFVFRTQ